MSAKISGPAVGTIESLDPVWTRLRNEAEAVVASEPALAGFVYTYVLNHARLEDAVAHRIADRLDSPAFDGDLISRAFAEMLEREHAYPVALRADLVAVYDRDPACTRFIEPVLYFKGFHAIQTHRLAHWLHGNGRRDFAFYLQSQASEVFQVDINPARADGPRHLHRPCDRRRRRRDRGDRGRRLDPAERDARRHRQGDRRPPSKNPPRRADRRRRQDPRQYRDRALLAGRGRVGRAESRFRRTPRSPAFRPGSSGRPAAPSRRGAWTRCCATAIATSASESRSRIVGDCGAALAVLRRPRSSSMPRPK